MIFANKCLVFSFQVTLIFEASSFARCIATCHFVQSWPRERSNCLKVDIWGKRNIWPGHTNRMKPEWVCPTWWTSGRIIRFDICEKGNICADCLLSLYSGLGSHWHTLHGAERETSGQSWVWKFEGYTWHFDTCQQVKRVIMPIGLRTLGPQHWHTE